MVPIVKGNFRPSGRSLDGYAAGCGFNSWLSIGKNSSLRRGVCYVIVKQGHRPKL